MRKIIISLLIIALIALAGCAQENTINVEGTSEITVDPDQAEVWVGASIVDDSADLAQNQVNTIINDIIDSLKAEGIPEEDISTERLNLYEEISWDNGKREVIGWRATQTLKVKTKELNKVGQIVDIAVGNGANQVQSVNFGLSEEKEQEYKKQAIAAATTNAKEKAETIADSLGAKLGSIRSVSESGFYYRGYDYAVSKTGPEVAEAAAEVSQVLPGDVTVTARINIVYNIK